MKKRLILSAALLMVFGCSADKFEKWLHGENTCDGKTIFGPDGSRHCKKN